MLERPALKSVSIVASAILIFFFLFVGCGGSGKPDCRTTGCSLPERCNVTTGVCAKPADGTGGGTGGSSSGTGGSSATGGNSGTGGSSSGSGGGLGMLNCLADNTGCSGGTPVCDSAAFGGKGTCVTCTPTKGCMAPAAICVTSVLGGQCVQCLANSDCGGGGKTCDLTNNTCVAPVVIDSGTDAGRDGGPDAGPFDAGPALFPYCVPRDGGVVFCTAECNQGFHCENGACVLNGGGGPIQITLTWNTHEDFDLHLLEPTSTGPCEIYYGDANRINDAGFGSPSSCGARGSLDLDSEAACPFTPDNVDVENIIFPPGPVTSGMYTVRVDHWKNCDTTLSAVPFQVEVRVNTQIIGYCGVFYDTDTDWDNHGGAGSGRTVITFNVP